MRRPYEPKSCGHDQITDCQCPVSEESLAFPLREATHNKVAKILSRRSKKKPQVISSTPRDPSSVSFQMKDYRVGRSLAIAPELALVCDICWPADPVTDWGAG